MQPFLPLALFHKKTARLISDPQIPGNSQRTDTNGIPGCTDRSAITSGPLSARPLRISVLKCGNPEFWTA